MRSVRIILFLFAVALPPAYGANPLRALCGLISRAAERVSAMVWRQPPPITLISTKFEKGFPGNFEPVDVLGKGTYGVVVRMRLDGKDLSVKVPSKPEDALTLHLLEREREANERLGRWARIYKGENPGEVALVYEYVAGTPLSQYLHENVISPDQALKLIEQVDKARERITAAGLADNDFKESNLILAEDGTIHPIDMGCVGFLNRPDRHPSQGHTVGTPTHMRAVQMGGELNDWRNDLYAASIVNARIMAAARHSPLKYAVKFPGIGVEYESLVPREVYEIIHAEMSKYSGVAEFRELDTPAPRAFGSPGSATLPTINVSE